MIIDVQPKKVEQNLSGSGKKGSPSGNIGLSICASYLAGHQRKKTHSRYNGAHLKKVNGQIASGKK